MVFDRRAQLGPYFWRQGICEEDRPAECARILSGVISRVSGILPNSRRKEGNKEAEDHRERY